MDKETRESVKVEAETDEQEVKEPVVLEVHDCHHTEKTEDL